MKIQQFSITTQLFVLVGCAGRENGILSNLISAASWFPAHFDQLLVITDRCTIEAIFKEHGMYFACSVSVDLLENFCIEDVSCMSSTAVLLSYPNTTMTEEAIYKIAGLERYWHIFYFIFLNGNENVDKFLRLMEAVSLVSPADSNVYWILQHGGQDTTNEEFLMWETYSVKDIACPGPVPSSNIQDISFFGEIVEEKWRRRRDFRGSVITATAVNDPDYADEVALSTDEMGNLVLDRGLAVDIYRIFQQELNFTENMVQGYYMMATSNPEIPGMDIHLINGTADVSITLSTLSESHALVVQMLHATTATWIEARFSRRPPSHFRFFRNPFSNVMWLLTSAHLFLIFVVFRLFHRLLFKHRDVAQWVGDDEGNRPLLSALWALGSVCLQSCCGWPRVLSLKILFLVASVTGFLLNSSYAAVLTAQLCVKEKIEATLEKLLDLKYNFHLEEDVPFPVDLEDFPQWQPTSVSMIDTDNELVQAGEALSETRSALVSFPEFFHSAMQSANYSDSKACEMFDIIRVSSSPALCSMNVKKSSPFKEIFNLKTALILNRGIVRRLYKHYKRDTLLQCSSSSSGETNLVPQTLTELTVAYILLSSGAAAAFFVLCLERLTVGSKNGSSLWRRKTSVVPFLYIP